MTMLKSAAIYTLHNAPNIDHDDLVAALNEKAAVDLHKTQKSSIGWGSPGEKQGLPIMHELEGQRLLSVLVQERSLPADVIKEDTETEVAAREERTGQKVTAKEKRNIKEEITIALLPKAFVRKKRIPVWWDVRRNRIVVSASAKKAEDVLDLLRETLGSLQATPLAVKEMPSRKMTEWVQDKEPDWMELGGDALIAEASGESSYAAKKAELHSEETQKLLEVGRQVTKLSFSTAECDQVVLSSDLSLKGIKYSDAVKAQADDIETGDSLAAKIEADFIIMAAALSGVIDQLVDAMGGLATESDA